MKNSDRYKTAKERGDAFLRFCDSNKDDCASCKLRNNSCEPRTCAFHWLDLEAPAEEPLPCPFCGGKMLVCNDKDVIWLHCCGCGYYSAMKHNRNAAIAAHNRVARAVKEKEARND